MTGLAQHRATPPEMTTGRSIRLAICFGLLTGIGSASLIGVQKFILDDVTLSSPQMVWTAPLMLAVLGIPIGAILSLLVRALPRHHRVRGLVFALALTSCAIGLMVWGRQLADISVVILSLGIAVQLSYLAAQRWDLFRRMVRVGTVAGAAIVLLAAGVVNLGAPLRERSRVAALPRASADAPNVLIIILDTVRALNLSLHGYERPTSPNLERIARRGTMFEYAFSPASWTLPSHASMFTGRPAHELSANWAERLDGSAPTLAEYFRDRGYRTGGVVGNWFYCNSEWGIDRGFLHYSDFANSLGHALASTSLSNKLLKWMESRWDHRFWFHRLGGRRIAPDISRHLLRWLERDRDRPYFAFVNYYDAHDPYIAPDPYVERFVGLPRADSVPVRVIRDGRLDDARSQQRQNSLRGHDMYDAAIAYLDGQIGQLFEQLEERGLLENTIVIITSDHGEEFGENGYYWHGLSVFGPSVHVPLIIVYPPTVPANRRVTAAASLTDLAATVRKLANLDSARIFPGSSLDRFWNGSIIDENRVVTSVRLRNPRPATKEAELRSVITDELQYVVSDVGLEALFRYRSDPLDQNDLARTDSLASLTIPALRNSLEAGDPWIKEPDRITAAARRPK